MYNSVCVIIDCENVDPNQFEWMYAEIGRLGVITKNIAVAAPRHQYTTRWKPLLMDYSIALIGYDATGKNSADFELTIRAMDALHTGDYDAFAIVSSDGDFTLLARRLNRGGKAVICAGTGPKSRFLARACDHLIDIDNQATMEKLQQNFVDAYEFLCPTTPRQVSLKNLTRTMKMLVPGIDLSKYPAKSWKDLIRRFPETFEVLEVGTGVIVQRREYPVHEPRQETPPQQGEEVRAAFDL